MENTFTLFANATESQPPSEVGSIPISQKSSIEAHRGELGRIIYVVGYRIEIQT